MTEYTKPEQGEWIQPRMTGYKLACCDCGLVHRLDFRIAETKSGDLKIQFRAYRDGLATGGKRRHMGKFKFAMLALALTLSVSNARAQDTSGFAIAPDGQVYQWDQNGGTTYGPDGSGSWDSNGGYTASPDGGYSTWSGQADPLVPADPLILQPQE